MKLSPTCFPEFSVSENRHDDQQVAQHVYHYSGDEHAGQQSEPPEKGETLVVSTGGRSVPEKGDRLLHHPHFMLRAAGRQHAPQPSAPLAHKGRVRGTARYQPRTARAPHCAPTSARGALLEQPRNTESMKPRVSCHYRKNSFREVSAVRVAIMICLIFKRVCNCKISNQKKVERIIVYVHIRVMILFRRMQYIVFTVSLRPLRCERIEID